METTQWHHCEDQLWDHTLKTICETTHWRPTVRPHTEDQLWDHTHWRPTMRPHTLKTNCETTYIEDQLWDHTHWRPTVRPHTVIHWQHTVKTNCQPTCCSHRSTVIPSSPSTNQWQSFLPVSELTIQCSHQQSITKPNGQGAILALGIYSHLWPPLANSEKGWWGPLSQLLCWIPTESLINETQYETVNCVCVCVCLAHVVINLFLAVTVICLKKNSLFICLTLNYMFNLSPSCNHTGWLGVKH